MAEIGSVDETELVRIAHLFYIEELSKIEIGDRLGISRFKVTRALRRARELGLVRIELSGPFSALVRMERELASAFGLQQAILSSTPQDADANNVRRAVAASAAAFFAEHIRRGEVIGTTWSRTLASMTDLLPDDPHRGITVVELMGSSGFLPKDFSALNVSARLAERLGGRCFYLPIPVIVDSIQVRDVFLSDTAIRRTLAMFDQLSTAIMGVGPVSDDQLSYRAGLLTAQDIARMASLGAVCYVCGHFYNIHGDLVDGGLEDRTIAIGREQLLKVPRRVLVAGGLAKVPTILGALRAGLGTVLVTDEATARALIAANETGDPSLPGDLRR
ncbi:MAG TPA: sugar-binding transcriptional regulator [Chloroflexota bacterium]